uniref:Uncharacterized protein n=1 Tax=Medicago truncatula TaxID=3880 RepID=I3S1I4_MEDTR|nr:unknown [Medicago truncatula]
MLQSRYTPVSFSLNLSVSPFTVRQHSMKLSYSTALFLPPVLSNLETSKVQYHRRNSITQTQQRISQTRLNQILPLLSLSNLSNIPLQL